MKSKIFAVILLAVGAAFAPSTWAAAAGDDCGVGLSLDGTLADLGNGVLVCIFPS